MKVLVLGGTGFIGNELTRELAARGHDVTVLARTPSDDASNEFRTVNGDVTDYDSIEGAFQGQDAVVNLVALSPLYTPPGGNEMHDRIHRGGTENVIAAAQAHGVEKVVQLSALGADPDGPTAYIRAKGAAEELVRDSSLDWVVVRPSVVFGEGGEFVSFTKTLTTPYVTGLPGGGSTRFQPIWVGDFVPILADCVDRDGHVGETYELGGPEVLTLADVTRAVYRADGKSVRILPVPMLLARIGLSIAGLIPGFPMGGDQYRSLAFDNTVSDNSLDEFGLDSRDLYTFGEYLKTNDEPAGVKEPDATGGVQG
jgi:NADH dehydrogenase